MNHYDTLIRDYFYEHKFVSFEKVGNLTLDNRHVSAEQPPQPDAVKFQFDKRAETTPALADFIAAKTGKNKVLINSDLESFVELMRQFMNIGKPYEMDGVGMFKMGRSGEYEFAPFDSSYKKDDSKAAKRQREKDDYPLSVKKTTNRSALMLFALVIVLGVLAVVGWGTYKIFFAKNAVPQVTGTDTITQNTLLTPVLPDTANTVVHDSMIKPDTTGVATGDSAEYKFIHETTTSAARAYERAATLKSWGHPSLMDSLKRDSVTVYTLYLKYKLSNADTARMRDSIQKLLNKKIRIRPAG